MNINSASHILYVRQNMDRKSRYQIATQFVKKNGKLSVVKKALTDQAISHIQHISLSEKKLESVLQPSVSIVRGKLKKNEISYPFLTAPTLQSQMETSLVQNDISQFHAYFKQGLEIIRSFPSVELQTNPWESDQEYWLGPGYAVDNIFLTSGVIDVTASNILLTSPKPSLLDCEWTFDFPTPKKFVEFRYWWQVVLDFSELMASRAEDLNLFWFNNSQLCIPSEWVNELQLNFDIDFPKLLQHEQHFQSMVLKTQQQLPFEYDGLTNWKMLGVSKKKIKLLKARYYLFHPSQFFFKKTRFQNWHDVYLRIKSKIRRFKLSTVLKPDVHQTDISSLCFQQSPVLKKQIPKTVTVVVPVFNAADDLKLCVESLRQNLPSYASVLLIDDASTDHQVKTVLAAANQLPRFKVHRRKKRHGFVKNVNYGMKQSKGDVILLNSDTIVTKDWIRNLQSTAYAFPNVATITPLTTNGEIVSVPNMTQNNALLSNYSLSEQAKLVTQISSRQLITTPTGVGFCMYITRNAIDTVGIFDEETFGLGYGEENDFCLRAHKLKMLNCIDDSTFIFHKGTSSFKAAEKQQQIEKNLSVINSKYPGYDMSVGSFIRNNPLSAQQQLLKVADKLPDFFTRPVVLFIMHKNPFSVIGGVEDDAKVALSKIDPENLIVLLHRDDNLKSNQVFIKLVRAGKVLHQFSYSLQHRVSVYDLESKEVYYLLQWLCKAFHVKVAHIEHSSGWPITSLFALQSVEKVACNIHDFYYLCPIEKLVNEDNPHFEDLDTNLKTSYNWIRNRVSVANDYESKRHQAVLRFFKEVVDVIIYNSDYSKEVFESLFQDVLDQKTNHVCDPYV